MREKLNGVGSCYVNLLAIHFRGEEGLSISVDLGLGGQFRGSLKHYLQWNESACRKQPHSRSTFGRLRSRPISNTP
jgi:hypothetical protein